MKLYAKFSKREFWLDRVAFLGNIISSNGVEVDPSKVEAVKEWSIPKSVTEIRIFLGLAGYYRKFIQGFPSIAVHLTSLTKKIAKFIWGSECQDSFVKLKQALISMPVLSTPSGQGEYVLYTDASKLDALSSKATVITQLSLQRPLQSKIQRFEFTVYAKVEAPNLSTLSVQLALRDRISYGKSTDEQLQKWRARDEAKGRKLYSEVDDSDDCLRDLIMKKADDSTYSIHPGCTKMYKDLQLLYWWPCMKRDILRFVTECLTCQQVKAGHHRPAGNLSHFLFPSGNGTILLRTFLWDYRRLLRDSMPYG
ncbi:uncharacterized protein [Primulina eburnea]|uniref:uncharacterized protein n=1 Tax=Primulina eburnea TaxID=1245227 RepID=UPI003C6CC009